MDIKSVKRNISEWWEEHRTTVKLVVASSTIGILYGFIKGMNAANSCWLDAAKEVYVQDEERHLEVSEPAYLKAFDEKRGKPT